MSYVANVLIHFDETPEEDLVAGNISFEEVETRNKKIVKEINEFFRPAGEYGFTDFYFSSAIPSSKGFEAHLLIGAINFFERDRFIEHLRKMKWQNPKRVQLMLKDQEDERFQMIEVFH